MPVQFAMQINLTVELADPVELDLTYERRLRPLTQFMPPGIAWDLEPGSQLYQLLSALSRVLGRFDTWLRSAVRNLSPWTAEAELPRWEKLLRSKPDGLGWLGSASGSILGHLELDARPVMISCNAVWRWPMSCCVSPDDGVPSSLAP